MLGNCVLRCSSALFRFFMNIDYRRVERCKIWNGEDWGPYPCCSKQLNSHRNCQIRVCLIPFVSLLFILFYIFLYIYILSCPFNFEIKMAVWLNIVCQWKSRPFDVSSTYRNRDISNSILHPCCVCNWRVDIHVCLFFHHFQCLLWWIVFAVRIHQNPVSHLG